MRRFVKNLAYVACLAYCAVSIAAEEKAAQTEEKPDYKLAPGFEVNVPIINYDHLETFLTKHDHMLSFAYQPGKPSETFGFSQMKGIVSKLHKIDKSI